jgi:DNA (cytosine-5)-methyltransferase 1
MTQTQLPFDASETGRVKLKPEAPSATKKQTFRVVSMFSGCGGMDLGFLGGFKVFNRSYEALPFNISWANELNEAACRTYERNIGREIKPGDIWSLIHTLPRKADVLIGGFPCQDVSVNGKRKGLNGKRTSLYRAMVQAIKAVRPRVFVAENVKGLLTVHNKKAIEQVLSDFRNLGYKVSCDLYQAANYGIPQKRERNFIVGTAKGVKPFVPPPKPLSKTEWMTAEQAVRDLEGHPEDPSINHIWSRANRSPEQGNRVLLPSKPAHTIRAECHGNIQYHYVLPRRISMREAARFQSFPDSFIFEAKLRETERQVGNAVPPILAWHIAKSVLDCLESN